MVQDCRHGCRNRHDVAALRSVVDSISAVAACVRTARKEAGLTQGDLANLAETSERTIRAIETGTGNPSLRAVAAAVNVLGLRLTVTR